MNVELIFLDVSISAYGLDSATSTQQIVLLASDYMTD